MGVDRKALRLLLEKRENIYRADHDSVTALTRAVVAVEREIVDAAPALLDLLDEAEALLRDSKRILNDGGTGWGARRDALLARLDGAREEAK